MNAITLALFALLPAMIGPPAAQAPQDVVRLCSGRSIVLPRRQDGKDEAPCTLKGCHAATCRRPLLRPGTGARDE